MSDHYATSLLHDGHLYGYHGRQEYGPALRCIDAATGTVQWSEERFGAGSLIGIGDRLLLLHEDGRLLLIAADPNRFQPLAEARILDPVVRAFPAFSDGVLYARSEDELVAVKLR